MDEKPRKVATVSVIGTIDPKSLSIVSDAAKSLGRIDPKMFRLAGDSVRTLAGVEPQIRRVVEMSRITTLAYHSHTRLVDMSGIRTFGSIAQILDMAKTAREAHRLSDSPGLRDLSRMTAEFAAAYRAQAFATVERPVAHDFVPRLDQAVREAVAETGPVRPPRDGGSTNTVELSPAHVQLAALVTTGVQAAMSLIADLADRPEVARAADSFALLATLILIYLCLSGLDGSASGGDGRDRL